MGALNKREKQLKAIREAKKQKRLNALAPKESPGPADLGEQLPPPPFQQPQQEEEEISERELCEDDLLAEEQLLRLQQGSEARTAAAQGYAPAVWAGEEHAQCKVAPGPPAAEEEIASDPNVSYADLLAQEQRLRREAEARMAAAERKQAAAECEIARLRRQLASSLPTAKERRQLQLLREHNVSECTLKKLAPPGMPKHLTFGRSQRGPKPPPAPQAGAAAAAAEAENSAPALYMQNALELPPYFNPLFQAAAATAPGLLPYDPFQQAAAAAATTSLHFQLAAPFGAGGPPLLFPTAPLPCGMPEIAPAALLASGLPAEQQQQ